MDDEELKAIRLKVRDTFAQTMKDMVTQYPDNQDDFFRITALTLLEMALDINFVLMDRDPDKMLESVVAWLNEELPGTAIESYSFHSPGVKH